jgi:hypothetical protein
LDREKEEAGAADFMDVLAGRAGTMRDLPRTPPIDMLAANHMSVRATFFNRKP